MKRTTRLAQALAHLRRQQGLSIRDAARRAGMRPRRLKRYEAGSVEPRAKSIERILRALGVGPAALGRALAEQQGPTGHREQVVIDRLRRVSASIQIQLDRRLEISFQEDDTMEAGTTHRHRQEGSR